MELVNVLPKALYCIKCNQKLDLYLSFTHPKTREGSLHIKQDSLDNAILFDDIGTANYVKDLYLKSGKVMPQNVKYVHVTNYNERVSASDLCKMTSDGNINCYAKIENVNQFFR